MRSTPLIALALIAALCAPASAKGTVRVSQSDGTAQTYNNVTIRVVNQLLKIATSDGRGTLVISRAACSYVGELLHCLPYSITLYQNGRYLPLQFDTGSVYFNRTSRVQRIPNSSGTIAPNGMVLFARTRIGTRLSVTGKMDEVVTS